jgi:hypothetical protein
MKTIDLNYSTEYVNDSIIDTIRVINTYKLDKKQVNGYNRIWDGLCYIDFLTEFADEQRTELHLTGNKIGGRLTEREESQLLQKFIDNLERILRKEVVISAELLNVDPYKPVDGGMAFLDLIKLIVAIGVILYGLYTLFL